eukprot:TRINITY_DN2608_c0_g1_i2.p1 TRINITY_DN2608_c0_g1~~TRINITY_DN2608_c0_g1_i2.p1  ORF type:complete len:220 (-),score=46.97 TRINITY_DN2608_c0_g1_i2:110-769(-)
MGTETLLAEVDKDVEYGQIMARSVKILANNGYICEESVLLRKSFFCRQEGGALNQQIESNPMLSMMNPAMMTGMIKQSFMSQIYQIGLFVGMGYFFSGFVLAKLPFMLTHKFKSMLHQGFNIPLLDVSYVSSMSWAFLLIYGLQGIYSLIFDTNPVGDDLKMMNPGMMMGGGHPSQPKDYSKLFASKKDDFDLLKYSFVLDKSEEYLIQSFEKLSLIHI